MAFNPTAFGRRIAEHRGSQGVRSAAKEIGTSHSTLSRIENGHVPDLELFEQLCKWLGVAPGEILGSSPAESPPTRVSVHLRKKITTSENTAYALGDMILRAQAAIRAREGL